MNGESAFNNVLDRLVEAEKRSAEERERNYGSRNEIDLLKRDLNNARSDLTTAKVKLETFDNAADAVGALYEAVERAITRLSAIKTDAETALVEDLKTAMAAARKFIDPIPF